VQNILFENSVISNSQNGKKPVASSPYRYFANNILRSSTSFSYETPPLELLPLL